MTSHKKLPDIVERLESIPVCLTDAYLVEWLREIGGGRLVMSFEQTAELIREVLRLRAHRSDEARPSWDEAIEAAAIQCDKRAAIYRDRGDRLLANEAAACAKVIRALPRPSAPAEDGEGVREALRKLLLQLQADGEAWAVVQEWPEFNDAWGALTKAD
jgi:hypothetical protein